MRSKIIKIKGKVIELVGVWVGQSHDGEGKRLRRMWEGFLTTGVDLLKILETNQDFGVKGW